MGLFDNAETTPIYLGNTEPICTELPVTVSERIITDPNGGAYSGNIVVERSTRRTDCLPVDEKELLKWMPQLRPYAWIFYTDPASVKDLLSDFLISKLWRMNTLYKIVAKKDVDGEGLSIGFRMRRSQLAIYLSLMLHPRISVLKSRQIGVSTESMLLYGDDLWTRPMLTVGVVAQKQDAAVGLKSKVKYAWDNMDVGMRDFLGVRVVTDNDSTFGLSNGSTLTAGMSFRSGTLHRFAWTEVGEIAQKDPARVEETLSGTNQALAATKENWYISESTARGANYFKTQFLTAQANVGKPISLKGFRPLFFSWLDDPDCWSNIEVEVPPAVAEVVDTIEEQFKEYIASEAYKSQMLVNRSEDDYKLHPQQIWWMVGALTELAFDLELFFREYPHTPASAFYASSDAYFYKTVMDMAEQDGRLVGIEGVNLDAEEMSDNDYSIPDTPSILWDNGLTVFAVCDIGFKDPFHITYVQAYEAGFDSTGEPIIWTTILGDNWGTGNKTDFYADLIRDQPYNIDTIIIPHDGSRQTVLKDSISVVDDFLDEGFSVVPLIVTKNIIQDILYVRKRMLRTTFDVVNSSRTVQSLRAYRKVYDRTNDIYKSQPVHNWASHGADCVRYVAVSKEVSDTILSLSTRASFSSLDLEGGSEGFGSFGF